MITADKLEQMIRDIADKRGFFNRETRKYYVKEENMYLVCRDLAEKLNAPALVEV